MRPATSGILATLLVLDALQGGASAGIITGANIITLQGSTASVTNINRNAHTLDITKDFKGLEPIDIEFTVQGAGDVTAWKFNEIIRNNSGVEWNDFHFELGTGTGNGFRRLSVTDMLIFSGTLPVETIDPTGIQPFEDNSAAGQTVLSYINTEGGGVPSSPNNRLKFPNLTINVPDGLTKFTLRERPSTDGKLLPVPEPASVLLVLVALIALRMCRSDRALNRPAPAPSPFCP